MRLPSVVFAAVAAATLFSAPARAQSGAARYAGVQLEVAESFLDRARTAAAREDLARAGKLAWQAGVDARLTWAMTDSGVVRRDAAQVACQAAALIARLQQESRTAPARPGRLQSALSHSRGDAADLRAGARDSGCPSES